MPLSLLVTAANTPDAAVFQALLDDIPRISTPGVGGAVDPTRPTTPPLPRLPHAAKDRGADCPLCRGPIDSARPPPLEGGTLDRLAGRLPPAAHPLRPGFRAVLRLRHAGLRAAGLQPLGRHSPGAHTITLTRLSQFEVAVEPPLRCCVRPEECRPALARRADAAQRLGRIRALRGQSRGGSAKDQRVGARMSVSQPKTTRGRTR